MKRLFGLLLVLFAAFTFATATPTYAQTPDIDVVVQWTHPGVGSSPRNDDLAGFVVEA